MAHSHEHDHHHHSNNILVKLALIALGLTTALQVVIYIASGSVALLADTVHNLGDALNSIPLLFAL